MAHRSAGTGQEAYPANRMSATFVPLTAARAREVLAWMSLLYRHEDLFFDEPRALRAVEELIANPELGGIWWIEAEGVVAGYFVLTICYSLEFGGRFGMLDEFFIAEALRGKGIGTQALAFAAEWCRGRRLEALRLEVDPRNKRGQKLYRRSGFELQERYLMTRWL